MFSALAEFFASDAGNWCSWVFILLVGLVGFLVLGRFTIRCRRSVVQILHKLDEYESPDAFATGFEEFNLWAESNNLLSPGWKEFSMTLITPGPSDPALIRRSSPSSLYLNDTTMLGGMNTRLWNAFPGFLTGLGILGTFIGLAAGMYLAQQGLAWGDVEKMRQALSRLLSGASTAFVTSIVGLIGSVIFSWWEKGSIKDLEHKIGKLNTRLDALISPISFERIAEGAFQEMKIQTGELRRFNSELANAIGAALDERLASRLTPALERLLDSVNGLREDRSLSSDETLKQVVAQFKATLNDAAGHEIHALGATLAGVNSNLGSTLEAFATSRDQILEHMTSGLMVIEEGAQTLRKELSAGSEPLLRGIQELSAIVDEARRVIDDAAKAGDYWNLVCTDTAKEISVSVDGLRTGHDRLTSTLGDFSSTIGGIGPVVSGLNGCSGCLDRTAAQLRESSALLDDHASAVTGVWHEQQARFESLDVSLGKVFQEIMDGVGQFQSGVISFMTEVDNQFGSAIDKMSGAIQGLSDAVGELGEQIDEMRSASD